MLAEVSERKKKNKTGKNCDAPGATERMCVKKGEMKKKKKGEMINTAECFKRSCLKRLKLHLI